MITVKFEPGSHLIKVDGLWQYDRGQVLRIEGLDLTGTIAVDFSLSNKGGEAIPIACVTSKGVAEVTIPDILLASGRDKDYAIYAYIYRSTESAGETTEMVAMTVKARPSRQGQDTPVEPGAFDEAIEQVNDAAYRAEYAMALAESEAADIKADREQIQTNKTDIAALRETVDGYGYSVVDGVINVTYGMED